MISVKKKKKKAYDYVALIQHTDALLEKEAF